MLGLTDPIVITGYLLVIGTMLLCVIWGMAKWNKEGELSPEEVQEEKTWLAEELKIDKEVAGEDDQ